MVQDEQVNKWCITRNMLLGPGVGYIWNVDSDPNVVHPQLMRTGNAMHWGQILLCLENKQWEGQQIMTAIPRKGGGGLGIWKTLG